MTDPDAAVRQLLGNRIRLMSLASRYQALLCRSAWIVPAAAILAGILLFRGAMRVPASSAGAVRFQPRNPEWESSQAPVTANWTVFERRGPDMPGDTSLLAGRFRLAGTFFAFSEESGEKRKAILDVPKDRNQRIVVEGETIDDVHVVRIFRDRVVLREGAREEELWLSFSLSSAGRHLIEPQAGSADPRLPGTTAATVRFGGKRVGECRWVFKRESILAYYRELMDEPERLVNVFDSLKPLYGDNRKISGYRLGIEGERVFFDAVGLRDGDVVRSVNSMRMTNRRRAEYFIKEFVADRANAFVLDIERDGSQEKLIYQVR